MSFNVPVERRDPVTTEKKLNPNFGKEIDALVENSNPSAMIFYCRSGQRSSTGCYFPYCPRTFFDFNAGIEYYEVEAVDENGNAVNGKGGFEGSSSSNVYNGYRGFPGRLGDPVSFKDTGLPIVIGKAPIVNFTTTCPGTGTPWASKDDPCVE